MNKIKILHLEDDPDDSELVLFEFRSSGYEVDYTRVETEAEFTTRLENNNFDIILADYNLPTYDGISALRLCSDKYPDIPFIIVSGTMGEEIAVKMLKYGASDYLIKQNLKRLVTAVDHALDEARLKKAKLITEKELKYSEEKFRTITENSADAIFVTDKTGKYIFANKKVTELLGYTQEEMVHKTRSDLTPAHEAEKTTKMFNHLLTEGRLTGEIDLVKKDGNIVPVDLNAVILSDGSLYASCRDITDRRRTVEALEAAALRWANTFDAISDIVCIFSNDQKLLAINRAGYESAGQPADKLIGQHCFDCIHPSENRNIDCPCHSVREHGKSVSFEYEHNGKHYFRQIWSIPGSLGKLESFVHIIKDISEKKLIEKALQENEEKYRRIFEHTQDVYYQIDNKGDIAEISPSVTRLSGFSREELIGKPSTMFYYYPEERQQLLNELSQKGEVWDFEVRMRTRDNQIRYTSLNAHLMFDNEGKPMGIEGSLRDINERKHFEIQLEKAKEKAEGSDRLKTAFLHNISHEIRTPMNAIMGFSSLLGDPENSSETQRSYIQIIQDGSNQLLSIINDIVDISGIEANTIKKNITRVNLNTVLDSIFKQFQNRALSNRNKFKLSTGLDYLEAFVPTDNTKLIQILSNLLSNAFKFTKDGEIEFGYSLKEPMIEFFVSDTGIGIPEDQHEKIFENFYQVENELSRQYGGTGLGLAISKAYAELLGGRIWLTSKPGMGSVFYFNLPDNRSELEDSSDPQAKANKKIIFTSPVKILIAEDNDQNFSLISYQLSDPNIEIIRAVNGKDAVDICKNRDDLDLVLMDLKMPVMDGYAATEEIKVIRPGLPVIAQTALVTDREKAMKCGCVDLIFKPFKRDEILAAVGRHLGKKGSLEENLP